MESGDALREPAAGVEASTVKFNGSQPGEVNHMVPFSTGGLRPPHVKQIGPAYPLFLLLEDMVTTGEGKDGFVHGHAPVKDSDLAASLGIHEKTAGRWRRRLAKHKYIEARVTATGYKLTVRKSKKWEMKTELKRRSGSAPTQSTSAPRRSGSVPASETYPLGQIKEDVGETAAALKSLNPWNPLGSNLPMGSAPFQALWGHYYATRNGHLLSEAMEMCIQASGSRGVKVPPPFFEAKRRVEAQERRGSEAEEGLAIVRLEVEP